MLWVVAVSARPRLALGVLALLCVLAAAALTRLSVDTDSSRMLSPDLPFQAQAHALNTAFPELKNQILVVVRGPRLDPVEATIGALQAALAAEPAVATAFAPSAEPFFRRNGLLYLSADKLEARLTRLSKSANLLARLREDRSVTGFLAALDEAAQLAESADIDADALARLREEAAATFGAVRQGETRGFAWASVFEGGGPELRVLAVSPVLDFSKVNPAKAAMAGVARAVGALDPQLAGEVEIGVTGDPVLRAEELKSVTARMGISLALSLLIVGAVLLWALRSPGRVALALGALLVTLLLTAGAAAIGVGVLNLISIAFIVLMVGLGIDFAIHLMTYVEERAARSPPMRALAETADGLGPALLLTACTTSAAFLAFAATDFRGMAQLGAIGGVGVLIACAVALTLIPAAIALRPKLAGRGPVGPGPAAAPTVGSGRAGAGRAGLGSISVLGAAAALVMGLGALAFATNARFDADPMNLRNPEAPSVQAFGWLMADGDRAPLRLSLLAETADEAAAAVEDLGALEAVGRATWLGDFVPEAQEAKLALIDLAWPSVDFAVNGEAVALAGTAGADAAALAARYAGTPLGDELAAYLEDPTRYPGIEGALFRYFDALLARLEAQLEVDAVARDDLPEPLTARYRAADGTFRVDIAPADDISAPSARAAFVAAVASVQPGAAGPPAQIEGAAAAVAGAMVEATALALAVAALLAWATVRRLALVAAILVPVALAGVVTLALSAYLGLPLNYANIIVLPLLIGIGVDSGIHLALRADRTGAVFDTSTPRAVAGSALTTIGAFATLALSDHRGTSSMGVLLAIALVAALAMAFALTPVLARMSTRTVGPSLGDPT